MVVQQKCPTKHYQEQFLSAEPGRSNTEVLPPVTQKNKTKENLCSRLYLLLRWLISRGYTHAFQEDSPSFNWVLTRGGMLTHVASMHSKVYALQLW